MEKIIEIPEGYEARIEGNKVVLEPKESEDKRIRKEIIEYLTITREKDLVAHPERQRWIAYLEKQKEQKPAQYDIDILEKHITKDSISELAHNVIIRNGWEIVEKEQIPAERSEEDEENATYIGAALEAYYKLRKKQNNASGQMELDKAKEWLYNRFKSLRSQSHWKPSEAQMNALKQPVAYFGDSWVGKKQRDLESLYYDLQKLM